VRKALRGQRVRCLVRQRYEARRGRYQRHTGAEPAATADLDAKSDEGQFFKPPLTQCSGQAVALGAAERQKTGQPLVLHPHSAFGGVELKPCVATPPPSCPGTAAMCGLTPRSTADPLRQAL
jgi:hypothetical protein